MLADTSGDTNNNNMVGGTAFQQQRPIRRGSDQLGSLSFSSEQQQPGGSLPTSREHTSFRGNRRDCDFRDGPSSLSATSAANSNNSADGNRPLLFRSSTEGSDAAFPRGGVARVSSDSYYGPSGAALGSNSDFRRSPSQRGRPLFGANNHTNNSSSNAAAMAGSIGSGGGSNNSLPPPPLIGRQGSFPLQQQHGHHRRNDPRFVASGGGSVNDWSDAAFLPDVQRSQTTQHSRSSFMEGSDESSFKSSATEHSEIPAHRSSINNNNPLVLNRGTSDGDSFGRTREWMTNRTSPQSSPSLNNNRRPSGLKFFQQSPNEAPLPPLLPPTTVAATDTGALKESLLVPHPRETSSLTTVSVVERPPPLLTSALGAGLTDRAEKAVTDVNDVLGVAGVKLDTDKECLSKLPSKQHILQAIAKIDSTIKATQSKSEDRKKSLDEALEEERLQRQKAEEFAIAESRRQAELLLENEANKRNEKERAHEEEISQFISERNAVFEIEQSTALLDLATKLKVATEDADKKIRDAVNEQMITTADSFDKDIVKMRKEHEKAKQASKKTELRLSAVEKDYQGKAKVIKNDGLAASATAPASCNVVSRVIAENRRKAAEAHMNQLTFLSQDADLKELDIVYQEQANIKDPIAGKTAIEWAQMAKQVTGLADALYTELCEAPYFESNLKTHEIIAPMVKEFVRHKQHKLKKQWIQLAEEYEYRRTLHEKQLQSAVHTKDRPKKSVSVPVRHSIFEGGKPSQPSLESASSRTSTNPYRRARRGNEVRSEYEQEQIIAEIAVKEALEKRIMFGGTDLPRQIGSLERELNCQFVNTFNAQRVDVIEQERVLSFTNVWSDMEKAVFLDRYEQLRCVVRFVLISMLTLSF